MKFKRSVGPLGLLLASVSGIFGSGWLFGPYYAAQMAGPAALLAWLLGGIATIVIAMTFAETTCMFPISGSSARVMLFSHGTLANFLFTWIMWIGYAAVAPIETMGVLQYLASALPHLIQVRQNVVLLSGAGYVVAAAILLLMCVINFFSIRWVMRYNAVMVWFKIIIPVVVIAALLSVHFATNHFSHFGGFMPTGFGGVAGALSLGGVMLSFAGFAPAIVLAGEAKNPQRVIPLVLFSSIGICMLIYCLLELAFVGAVPNSALSQGWAHLHFPEDISPFVGIANVLGLHYIQHLTFLIAILAPLGTAFIFVATTARVTYAMGKSHTFPKIVTRLNQRGVPFVAVILNFVLGMILFFPAPGWQGMSGILVAAFVMTYSIGPLCLVAFRKNLPDVKRPYRLPIGFIWSFVAFYLSNLVVYWVGWSIFSNMAIAIVVGLLLLFWRSDCFRNSNLELKHGVWAIVYFTGMIAFSFFGNYGGGQHDLRGYSDLWGLAIFSLVILLWARASTLPTDVIKSRIEAEKLGVESA